MAYFQGRRKIWYQQWLHPPCLEYKLAEQLLCFSFYYFAVCFCWSDVGLAVLLIYYYDRLHSHERRQVPPSEALTLARELNLGSPDRMSAHPYSVGDSREVNNANWQLVFGMFSWRFLTWHVASYFFSLYFCKLCVKKKKKKKKKKKMWKIAGIFCASALRFVGSWRA